MPPHPSCDERISIVSELENLGLVEHAMRHMEDAISSPGCFYSASAMRIHDAMMCPSFYHSIDSVVWWRNRLDSRISALLNECSMRNNFNLSDLSSFSIPGLFYSVYHGFNGKALMRKAYKLLICAHPKLESTNLNSSLSATNILPLDPHNIITNLSIIKRRRRIGFISAFFYRHSVCKLFCGVIAGLSRSKFDIYIISPFDAHDNWTTSVLDVVGTHVIRFPNGANIHDVVMPLALDVLVFTDIGMHPSTSM
jgi:hypothetical protein